MEILSPGMKMGKLAKKWGERKCMDSNSLAMRETHRGTEENVDMVWIREVFRVLIRSLY
jgi:hypothetical protein